MGTDLGIGSILTGLYDHLDRYADEIVIAETRVKHVETMLRQAKEILELRRDNLACARQAVDAVGRIR